MFRMMLKAKIHRAKVTGADLEYEGSITVDSRLLDTADILPHEKVHVLNVQNGARIETYALPAPAGSGEIIINGAAAHHFTVGDLAIIISYAAYEESEISGYGPKIVQVDENNEATVVRDGPSLVERPL
ncbi:MAG: aspartate 1-decarboxylase [Terriglobia bacterium]